LLGETLVVREFLIGATSRATGCCGQTIEHSRDDGPEGFSLFRLLADMYRWLRRGLGGGAKAPKSGAALAVAVNYLSFGWKLIAL